MQTDPRSIFITATDTGVGKTVWTSALLYWARKAGLPTLPCKPVQSGCRGENNRYMATDLEFALRTAGLELPSEMIDTLSPIKLRDACSPHLAAERMGIEIDCPGLIAHLRALLETEQHLLFEGAGGVHVPIQRKFSVLDLIQEMNLPVLLVTRSDLGTLNHTLLTLEALTSRGIEILGVGCSPPVPETPAWMVEDNLKILRETSGVPVWGPLERIPDLDTEQPPPPCWPEGSKALFEQILTHIGWT